MTSKDNNLRQKFRHRWFFKTKVLRAIFCHMILQMIKQHHNPHTQPKISATEHYSIANNVIKFNNSFI